MSEDLRLSSPSALRNRGPIAEVLRNILPESGTILEIASGSGEHVTSFAASFPALTWQPSDPSVQARTSISQWIEAEAVANVLPPLDLDAASGTWPVDRADAIIAINMIHISPWQATEGLLRGAGRCLPAGGLLFLYGPFRREGHPFAQTNLDFDASLRARDPAWGIRRLEDVANLAGQSGLILTSVIEMPANNLSVVFRRH
jgi:cyclopropane fatty-acyl-phospholipid synthase-like methyltransferase